MFPTVLRKTFSSLVGALLLVLPMLTGCTAATATKVEKPTFMFWPAAPDAPHVQFLTSFSSTADITQKQSQMEDFLYGQNVTGDLPIERPYGVRMVNGKLYVCDASADAVCILDLRKHEVRILGQTGQVHLSKPIDIAVAPDDVKYVADTGHGAVIVYDASDKYAGRISVANMHPVSVAVRGNELYVSDYAASIVRIFDRFNGKELLDSKGLPRHVGERGTANGQFAGCMGIALDNQSNLYVNDVLGCRIQKFSPTGEFLWSMGDRGFHPGQFARPNLMAVDSEGIVYAVDTAFQNVQMFNDKGQMLMYFGGMGGFPGAMELPGGVCVSDTDVDLFAPYIHPAFEAKRIVVVTSQTGPKRVNIFALGQLKPGKTLADISNGRIQGLFGFASETPKDVLQLTPEGTTPPATQSATQPAAPASATQPALTQPAASAPQAPAPANPAVPF